MTPIKPTIKLFTTQDDNGTGIQVNSLIINHHGNNYHLRGSTGDTIHVFTQSIALYVLSINKSNGTMELNAFMASEPDPINGVCLHTHQEITEALGLNWERLSPKTIVVKLINYLI